MLATEHVVAVFDWRFLKNMTARSTPEPRTDHERTSARDEGHGLDHGGQHDG